MTLVRTIPDMRFQGLFDNFFAPDFQLLNRGGLATGGSSLPKVNIKESKDDYQVELAVPGMAKEDFSIKLDDNLLSISSTKTGETTKEDHAYTRKEFSYQAFERRFTLPEDVDTEKISASYVNGVLQIHIPKREEAKPQPPKHITVA
ncbi:MAG TPA: Hsp20/alpha crystallin family protein [Cyclobacteriaceae bacterium]|nr:Hsp20/alpha crystallin family protein [Cyclobacteriaceae bacterium]